MCFNARYRYRVAMRWAWMHGYMEAYKYWLEELRKAEELERSFEYYQVSAFSHPKVIIYENNDPYKPQLSIWGLIPDWAKNPVSIWNNTLNARGETILEKPAFKKSAESKRCIIPVEGFYEHHDYKGKKYPFYITSKDKEPMYIAGLWNEWTNKDTGEIMNTFAVVTTKANPIMAKINNKPKTSNDHRMPVILPEGMREEWLKPLSKKEIKEIATYIFPEGKLDFWTVKKLSGKESPGNVPEANEKHLYPDLKFNSDEEPTLFD